MAIPLASFGSIANNVAVVVSVLLALHLAHRNLGISRGRALGILLVLALCALAGGRLHYIANHPGAYATRWHEVVMLWKGGFHLPGGLVGLALMAPAVCRGFGVSAGRFGDAITPAVALGAAITRLGCSIAGCCTGEVCHRAWCLAFPQGTTTYNMHRHFDLVAPEATHSLPVLPLNVFFLGAAIGIAALSVWWMPRKRYDGQVALMALTLFAVSTALLEPHRAFVPPLGFWGPLSKLAWQTLALALGCGVTWLWAEIRYRRRVPADRTSALA